MDLVLTGASQHPEEKGLPFTPLCRQAVGRLHMGKMKKTDNFGPTRLLGNGPLRQFCFLCEMLKPFGRVMWPYLPEFLKGTCLLILAVHTLVAHPTNLGCRAVRARAVGLCNGGRTSPLGSVFLPTSACARVAPSARLLFHVAKTFLSFDVSTGLL